MVCCQQFPNLHPEFGGEARKTVEGHSRISVHVVALVAMCDDAEVQARSFARE
jgi:hypothetical protein